jgi:hypothetical protein
VLDRPTTLADGPETDPDSTVDVENAKSTSRVGISQVDAPSESKERTQVDLNRAWCRTTLYPYELNVRPDRLDPQLPVLR